MPAPEQLHAALDAIHDGQDVAVVEREIRQGPLPDATVRTVIEQLLTIPDEQVVGARTAVSDLESVMRGIADRVACSSTHVWLDERHGHRPHLLRCARGHAHDGEHGVVREHVLHSWPQ